MDPLIYNTLLSTVDFGLHSALLLYFIFSVVSNQNISFQDLATENFKSKLIFAAIIFHAELGSLVFAPLPSFIFMLCSTILYFSISMNLALIAYNNVQSAHAVEEISGNASEKIKKTLKKLLASRNFQSSKNKFIIFLLCSCNLGLIRSMYSSFQDLKTEFNTNYINYLKSFINIESFPEILLCMLFIMLFYFAETVGLRFILYVLNLFLKLIKFNRVILTWIYIILAVSFLCLSLLNLKYAISEYKFI